MVFFSVADTVFAASGFRIIPSLNGVVAAQTKLRNNKYIIEVITKDLNLKNFETIKNDRSKINNIENIKNIIINNLYFKYESSSKEVLKNINLNIETNKSTGIIGKSGAGKTTLLDIILG